MVKTVFPITTSQYQKLGSTPRGSLCRCGSESYSKTDFTDVVSDLLTSFIEADIMTLSSLVVHILNHRKGHV